jgi:hypothetical protein
VFSLIAGTIVTILVVSSMQGAATSNETTATEQARAALDMMSRDLRCAGFNTDITYATPQPPIAYVDSMQILINADLTPYPDTSATALGVPLAYDPTGSPRPKPLIGTTWTPPIRYRTGAELIRYTLDLNNDGAVDANDLAVADGADANHTRNPNDYELCREVYGDSTAGVLHNNGGARERIAVIRKPGGSQPAMFRVYLSGSSTPWDWRTGGPIPAGRLAEITRIEITVVATAASRNFFGGYSDTRLTTTVSEIRNAPNYSGTRYNISGYVWGDADKNGAKNGTEVYVSGASVMLGGYMTQTTGTTGTYSFDVPPGSYWLTQTPPPNYGTLDNPDSFLVTVGPNFVKNLRDTIRAGGNVTVLCYNDVDKNHSYGGSDTPLANVVCNIQGTDVTDLTDNSGTVSFFLPVGISWINATLPDSFVASSQNPVKVTMTNGGNLTARIGMYVQDSGTITGTVFNDANGNGTKDTGENGVADAIVTVVLADSTEMYVTSDGTGKYTLKLPANDPPKTYAYTLTCTPPAGFSSGSKMSLTNVWLQNYQVLSSKDFALGKFNTTKFDVNEPVRALALADVIENDWLGQNTGFRHKDLDLITGSAVGTTSRLAVWFNQYNASPLFKNNPSSTSTTGQSIYALATDTLRAGSGGITRPAIIAGMRYAAAGNWSIWYPIDAIGNSGFLPASAAASYLTSDNGDVTAVATLAPTAGNSPGVVVGTNSPTANQGVVELWTAASHANPAYVRSQTISYYAGFPGGPQLGAVTGVIVSDFYSGVAGTELVIATQTGYYTGQVFVFKQVAGVWTFAWGQNLTQDAVTSICLADIDHDGKPDIVAGTQDSHTTGKLYYWHNKGGGTINFDTAVTKTAPGIVTALAPADFNGDGHNDIVLGWRDSDTTFGGGVQIWYVSGSTFPSSGTDPSSGAVNKWVTDLFVTDVNWGVYPVLPSGTVAPDIVGTTQKDANHSEVFTLLR